MFLLLWSILTFIAVLTIGANLIFCAFVSLMFMVIINVASWAILGIGF